MSLPYILEEKSVIRKENSEKALVEVLSEAKDWVESFQRSTSLTNKYFYANVFDVGTKRKYFVYTDAATEYFNLSNSTIELADGAVSSTTELETPGYSEDEVLTEKRWIDGKPIYRKVVKLGDLSSYANNDYKFHTSYLGLPDNLGKQISTEFMQEDIHGGCSFSSSNDCEWYFRRNAFTFRFSKQYVNFWKDVNIVVHYTKETDTSTSPVAIPKVVFQDVYSEEETLTNKIFMGKPVYRKIVKLGNLSKYHGGKWHEKSFGINNIDTQISVERFGCMSKIQNYYETTDEWQIRDMITTNKYHFIFTDRYDSSFKDVNFIVEYTKKEEE